MTAARMTLSPATGLHCATCCCVPLPGRFADRDADTGVDTHDASVGEQPQHEQLKPYSGPNSANEHGDEDQAANIAAPVGQSEQVGCMLEEVGARLEEEVSAVAEGESDAGANQREDGVDGDIDMRDAGEADDTQAGEARERHLLQRPALMTMMMETMRGSTATPSSNRNDTMDRQTSSSPSSSQPIISSPTDTTASSHRPSPTATNDPHPQPLITRGVQAEFEAWLAARGSILGISPFPLKTRIVWAAHARSATVQGLVQTLQAWLRVARQQQQQYSASGQRLEMPTMVPASSTAADAGGDLALAVRTFRVCERATALGSQAVLCRRLCYANLYRLNERAREQSVHGSTSRGQLFRLCYPEFAALDDRLDGLTGEARAALSRLSRDIHYGGIICRFADHFSSPEAALLLQPAIPDRFLRKLNAAQAQLWTDMVCCMSKPTAHELRCLWSAATLIVNQAIDLQSYRFPFENVRWEASRCVDVETSRLVHASIEELLKPFPVTCMGRGATEAPSTVPTALSKAQSQPLSYFPSTNAAGMSECRETEPALDIDTGGRVGERATGTETDGCQPSASLDPPSSVFGAGMIWDEDDEFRQALRYIDARSA